MARAKTKETLEKESKIVRSGKVVTQFKKFMGKYAAAKMIVDVNKAKLEKSKTFAAYTKAVENLSKINTSIIALGMQIDGDQTLEETIKIGNGKLGICAASRTINQKKLLKVIGQEKFNEIAVIPLKALDDVLDEKQKKQIVKTVNDGNRKFSFKFSKK